MRPCKKSSVYESGAVSLCSIGFLHYRLTTRVFTAGLFAGEVFHFINQETNRPDPFFIGFESLTLSSHRVHPGLWASNESKVIEHLLTFAWQKREDSELGCWHIVLKPPPP